MKETLGLVAVDKEIMKAAAALVVKETLGLAAADKEIVKTVLMILQENKAAMIQMKKIMINLKTHSMSNFRTTKAMNHIKSILTLL